MMKFPTLLLATFLLCHPAFASSTSTKAAAREEARKKALLNLAHEANRIEKVQKQDSEKNLCQGYDSYEDLPEECKRIVNAIPKKKEPPKSAEPVDDDMAYEDEPGELLGDDAGGDESEDPRLQDHY